MFVLNPDQQEAVNAIDGVVTVIAGPGSGKTRVLVERFLKMLTMGVSQKDILNLTFTNAAAQEMCNRVGILNSEKVFRTFHSFALDLMKRERRYVPFNLSDTVLPLRGEDYKLLFELVDRYSRNGITNFRTLQGRLSEWKRANIEPEQAMRESVGPEYYYALAYEEYEQTSRERGWLDFDSLMRETVKLLEDRPDVRERNRKRYIAVDECQDTDITQFRLLQLLFDGNIFVVGDENQLIYEWRSAQPGNLSQFEKHFPGARKIYLGQNYRSTKSLVDFFKTILPVDNGLASYMKTDNADGEYPRFIQFLDTYTEVRTVLDEAAQDPDHSVIIARTNRQLFDVQRMATEKQIKYENLGKKDFWKLNEVKALLKLAKEHNLNLPAGDVLNSIFQNDLPWYHRMPGDPVEGVPVENMANVVRLARNKNMSTGEFLLWVNKVAYAKKNTKDRYLQLATVHQAKGREWKNVYVIGAEQGKMPHDNGELDEERRIFFVACSRAAEKLQVSWAGNRSMFLSNEEFEIHQPGLDPVEGSYGASIREQQGHAVAETQLLGGE